MGGQHQQQKMAAQHHPQMQGGGNRPPPPKAQPPAKKSQTNPDVIMQCAVNSELIGEEHGASRLAVDVASAREARALMPCGPARSTSSSSCSYISSDPALRLVLCENDGIARAERAKVQKLGRVTHGGRKYVLEFVGSAGGCVRHIKEVAGNENTSRFVQEIYDATGLLVAVHGSLLGFGPQTAVKLRTR